MTELVVHGLGYVGLPTAAVFADECYDVVTFEIDPERLDAIDCRDPGTVVEYVTSFSKTDVEPERSRRRRVREEVLEITEVLVDGGF